MIEVRDITKIFYTHEGKERVAVDNLSFGVARGEVYGLFGPNGAGKTTMLRILAGLMRPTHGSVSIDGVSGADDTLALKQRAGFLTANTGLYGRLTPRETLQYFARLRGVDESKLDTHVDTLIKLLRIGEFANRRCDGMSTGEKQRVQIARTLIGDPPVLILDEPTNGLDVLSNRPIINFIQDAAAQGRTIILSTHHLDEVDHVCTRFGLMHQGRMLAEGTLAHLRELTGRELLSDIFVELYERLEGRSTEILEHVALKPGSLS